MSQPANTFFTTILCGCCGSADLTCKADMVWDGRKFFMEDVSGPWFCHTCDDEPDEVKEVPSEDYERFLEVQELAKAKRAEYGRN